jgi:site-specific DNA-methyltransferase (adenine-specific)
MAKATQATPPAGKIVPGDGLKTMGKWPDASVDLIFADPPYNIGYHYKLDKQGRANTKGKTVYDDNRSYKDYHEWSKKWISDCARVLKPTGSLYILIGDEYAAEVRMHLKSLEADGQLAFRNWIIWHYSFGQNCKAKFNRSHAHLMYCVGSAALNSWSVKDPPFAFNKADIAVPSARQTTYGDARAKPGGKLPDDTWYLRPQQAMAAAEAEGHELFGEDGDTWTMSRLCGTFKERLGWHPCQLPESLLERVIKLSSNQEDLVFDPFTGSGTTLAVAARLGRRWVGCELSEDYARRAAERIRHVEQTGQTLQATLEDKGIERGKPRKKAEPVRSPHLKGTRGRRVPGSAT